MIEQQVIVFLLNHNQLIDEEYNWNWNTPYFISAFDSKTLYVGGNYVLKSTDMGGTWKKISGDMTQRN